MSPPPAKKDTFAGRLSLLRAEAGISNRDQLATELGFAPTTYGNWERGDGAPGPDEIARICLRFAVAADWLVGLAETRTGLSPDSFLLDLSLIDAIRGVGSRPITDWPIEEIRGAWYAKVARRHKVADLREFEALRKELAPLIKKIETGRR